MELDVFSREKQVFLVGFSLTIPRFPRKSKSRLNTSLHWQVNYSVLLQPLQNLLAENHFLQ